MCIRDSSGTLRKGGKTHPLGAGDLRFEPTGERWVSPHTGGEYPIAFRVEVPNHNVATEVKSLLADQEVAPKGPNGIAYYEGAVRSPDRKAIGYLEMTGYAKPLGDAL